MISFQQQKGGRNLLESNFDTNQFNFQQSTKFAMNFFIKIFSKSPLTKLNNSMSLHWGYKEFVHDSSWSKQVEISTTSEILVNLSRQVTNTTCKTHKKSSSLKILSAIIVTSWRRHKNNELFFPSLALGTVELLSLKSPKNNKRTNLLNYWATEVLLGEEKVEIKQTRSDSHGRDDMKDWFHKNYFN